MCDRRAYAVLGALLVVAAAARGAHAQPVDRRYVEEPTEGLALPMVPLAGEHDARAVSANPGGLGLLRGSEYALVLDVEDPDIATSSGPGLGLFAARVIALPFLPRFSVGLGAEWLRPSTVKLAGDPSQPFRFTFAMAGSLGKNIGLGLSWHRFRYGGALDGTDSFDLGVSTRWGNHLAVGAALRDIATSPVGGNEVQRRYELEAMIRPLAHDALELAVGGRIGETDANLDGWARLSMRPTDGFTIHLGAETRALNALVGATETEVNGRDVRALLGLELSFGSTGVTAIAAGLRDDTGDRHFLGGQVVLRASTLGPPSVIGPSEHLERVELQGAIGLRELTSLVARLRAIARDSTAKGLVVTFDGVAGGWATLEELRTEILLVKKAGKKVFAYMVSGTGRDYFIATAADKIYVDPAGGVRLVGMAASTLFFRGAFDALGVLPQFEKIAEYKSAPESFTQTGPSETAAKMQNDLLDSMWNRWLTAVAEGRKLSKEEVAKLVDNGPYTSGDLAKDTKLVDAVGGPEKVAQLVATEMGVVLPVATAPIDRPDRWTRPAIAVIYIDGDIVDGASRQFPLVGQKLVGSETLVAAISAARADPRIGAIVLRIDTPGGSALASELISREVFATRGVKPILCSFSDVAASGGYFIAAGCDLIFAQPMSVTGSIGIFYGKFDVSGLAAKLGVSSTSYKRGARADVESYFRAYTEEERVVLLDKLRYMYSRFVGAVAEGRGMTKDAVDAVGRGHVYTGEQAQPIKLVDRFGGFGETLDEAKRRMKLAAGTKVTLVELPNTPSSLIGQLTGLLGLRAEESVSITDIPAVRELLLSVPASLLVSPDGAQARLPYQLSWD